MPPASDRSAAATTPQRNARGEARRASVIAAALRVVGAQGIGGLTHRAVAKEAQITPGLTTYYFPTIDELLEATLRTFVTEEAERIRTAMASLQHDDAPIDRQATLAAAFGAIGHDPAAPIAQFELYLESARRPGLRDVARACLEAYADLGRATLERLGAEDPDEGAHALLALLDGFAMRRIVIPDEEFDVAVVGPAVLRLVAAYAPEPG